MRELRAMGETNALSGRIRHFSRRAMLLRAADSQEQELETLRKMLTSLLAPFMVLVMGGIVLVIVMAILLPIFELNTSTF